jgi:hypothetical protein
MTELELIRTPGDRRRYALEDVGTLHLEGLFSRSANAEAGSDHWHFARSGFWQRVIQATDARGSVVACFVVRQLAVDAANDSAAGSTAAMSSTSG